MAYLQLLGIAAAFGILGYAFQTGATVLMIRERLFGTGLEIPGLRSWAVQLVRASPAAGFVKYRLHMLLDDPGSGREQRLVVESRLSGRSVLKGVMIIFMAPNPSGTRQVPQEVQQSALWKRLRNDLKANVSLADPEWIRMTVPKEILKPVAFHEVAEVLEDLQNELMRLAPNPHGGPIESFQGLELSSRESLDRQMGRERPIRRAFSFFSGLSYAVGLVGLLLMVVRLSGS